MASGFVQRFKGKVNAECLFVKGWGFSEVSTSTPAAGSTLSQDRANIILNAATAAVVYTLPPVEVGAMAKLLFQAVSSGIFVKAASGNNFGTIGSGGSTATVLKSTAQMTVSLIGVSSISWAVDSVWSTFSTAAAMAAPVFSTTT